jgi:hypothetical protein
LLLPSSWLLLLGLLFISKNGGDMFFKNIHQTTWSYNSEDRNLQNYCCRNFKSNILRFYSI